MEAVCPGEPKRGVNPGDLPLKTKKSKLCQNAKPISGQRKLKKSKN
jgi:hypothetical protein